MGGVMENITWVVVANSSHVKIFRVVKFPKIEVVRVMEHPESRLHDIDLVGAPPGRAFDRQGSARHAYEPKADPKHLEIEKFAKALGEHLSASQQKGAFSRLYLMASPSFLGLLRPHLSKPAQEVIIAEITKDMTDRPTADIEHHLAALR